MVIDARSDDALSQPHNALRKILLVASPGTVQFLDETSTGSADLPPE
ncbi:hypothetical protein ACTMTF_24420 [Nonomuraea sp. ZG12]